MMVEEELHKKVMKEFEVHEREFYHMCFEGSKFYEYVDYVEQETAKQIKSDLENEFDVAHACSCEKWCTCWKDFWKEKYGVDE